MALFGNIIWFILGGWANFLLYALLGVLFCITIIGIPVGKALFQYAKLMTFPFGKVIIKETELKGKENVSAIRRVGGTIANILWLPVGIATFIANIGLMLVCFVTIIGIPVGIVIAKSCKFLLWPVGAKVVTKEVAEMARRNNMMRNNAQMMGAYPMNQQPQAGPYVTNQQPQAGPYVTNQQPQAGPYMMNQQPLPVEPTVAATPEVKVTPEVVAEPEVIEEAAVAAEPEVVAEPEAVAEPEPVAQPAPAPQKRFCGQCGAEISAIANFCPKCGQKVNK